MKPPLPYSLLLLFLGMQQVFTQTPNQFSYKSVIRNSGNQLVSNQQVSIKISILQDNTNGPIVYSETHNPLTNTNGLVTLEIGGGTQLSGNFANINWAIGPYFVKTETDLNGGNNYTITSTQQLLSVPYALYAANAGNSTPAPQGSIGPQGPVGATGAVGPPGVQGPPGPQLPGSFEHYIGEHFGGGIIFFLWKDSLGEEHGLVVDIYDLLNNAAWNNNVNVEIGTPAHKTHRIMNEIISFYTHEQ
jgi:hypothetical protein